MIIMPLADLLFFQNGAHQCLFFRTKLREATVHFMADTGAMENFISARLVEQLGLETHPRKEPINVKIADGFTYRCEGLVQTTIRINTWTARMSLMFFPSTLQVVLGMPFFVKYDPRML